jgi:hypothetical protein
MPEREETLKDAAKHPRKSHSKDELKEKRNGNYVIPTETLIDEVHSFLLDKSMLEANCASANNGNKLKCSCLQVFCKDDEEDPYTQACARFVADFIRKSNADQKTVLVEWIRYARIVRPHPEHHHCRYIIPLSQANDGDDCFTYAALVCKSAIMVIIGVGVDFWNSCQTITTTNIVPNHGLQGKDSNRTMAATEELLYDELDLHFEELCQLEEPTATRYVREETPNSTGLRDGEASIRHLPPYHTKRGIFRTFCYGRGWKINTNGRGTNNKVERDDVEWTGLQIQPQLICSWRTFCRFWNKYYSNLRIHKPSYDICGECYRYYNRSKYVKRTADSEEDEAESQDKDENERQEQEKQDAEEDFVLNAALHVNRAQAQRTFLNLKHEEAIKNQVPQVAWSESIDVFIGDYCQNMSIPYVGAVQPGETYYFSPLSVFCFGMANLCHKDPTLDAYVYHEGEGKKGGNNVASLVYKFLRDSNYINTDLGPRKELTLCFDNCGGQNKNRMVIRLAMLFVELGFYKTVNILFLVAGHTKNHCDRLFNSLKTAMRRRNIFTFEQLMDCLDACDYVNAVRIDDPEETFKDFDKFEEQIYNVSQGVQVKHLFSSDESNIGCIVSRKSVLPQDEPFHENLKKNAATRVSLIQNFEANLTPLPVPGLKRIKQVELYKKWRPIVPPAYQHDVIYKHPGDDVIASINKEKSDKRKKKQNEQTPGRWTSL